MSYRPEHSVMVIVTGATGSGKSAICGEIELALKALGVPVVWRDGEAEKRLNHADYAHDIDLYKPRVIIQEVNIPGVPSALKAASKGE